MINQPKPFEASTVCSTSMELLHLALRNIIPELAPKLRSSRTLEEQAASVRKLAQDVRDGYPRRRSVLNNLGTLVQDILDADLKADLRSAIEGLSNVRKLVSELEGSDKHDSPSYFDWQSGPHYCTLLPKVELSRALSESIAQTTSDIEFVAHAMAMCASYRDSVQDERKMSDQDVVALNLADQLIETGTPLPNNYASLETAPTRKHKTYLSFADPGDGHLAITTQYPDLLEGLVVHIEYIDRDGIEDTDSVEAYRIPSVRNAARIRLRVGDVTPCSVYVGRPHFEGGFVTGLLKATHSIASTCSAMFRFGIAECKISMDNLTALEAVYFMRAVAGNVTRDPERQRLSGAFNINRPITDDRVPGVNSKRIEEPLSVALLAATLVRHGYFDKIAWDGSSKKIGSVPLIGQLKRADLLDAVHHAHSMGLETYISAGMKPSHMFDATIIGVGGVGIGTSLHKINDLRVGPILPDLVREALLQRNRGASHIAGKTAKLLAQMDWAYQEGSLPKYADGCRDKLFCALKDFLTSIDNETAAPTEKLLLDRLSDAFDDAIKYQAGARGKGPTNQERIHPTIEKAKRILLAHGDNKSSPNRYSADTLSALSILVNENRIPAIQKMLHGTSESSANNE